MTKPNVVILGAGVAGLGAAFHLAKRGFAQIKEGIAKEGVPLFGGRWLGATAREAREAEIAKRIGFTKK